MTVISQERKQFKTVIEKKTLLADSWKKEWDKQRADRP
jgi:hypothetical protein